MRRPGLGDHGSNAPFSVFPQFLLLFFFGEQLFVFLITNSAGEFFFLPSQANEGNLFWDDFNFQSMTVIKGSS